MTGWWGRLLCIDLTRRTSHARDIAGDLLTRWLGGRGLAGALVGPHMTLDWRDPGLPVVLAAGPLVGTGVPGSGRACLLSRSPLTGALGDANIGGTLGTALKRAGYDALVVTGRSDVPLALHLDDNRLTFESAADWTDRPMAAVTRHFQSRGSVMAVGPAADHGSRLATVIVDGHHAETRCGLGAVLAFKGLKVLAVHGTRSVRVADPATLATAVEDIQRLLAASSALTGPCGLAHFGTTALLDLTDQRAMLPTDHFRRTRPPAAERFNGPALRRRMGIQTGGCPSCPVRCRLADDRGRPLPDYEPLAAFTALLNQDDLDLAVAAHRRCLDLGLDPVGAAVTLAGYAEAENRPLGWTDSLLDELEAMALGRGPGRLLAQGARYTADQLGRPDLAMVVKGQEIPPYDPRGSTALALSYATSTRGACHLRANTLGPELLRKPVATDRFTTAGKARLVKTAEDVQAAVDSLVVCPWMLYGVSLEELAKAVAAVTGQPVSAAGLAAVGERIVVHERLLNHRVGFSSRHDDLPRRFFEEPGSRAGGIAVPALDRGEFLALRDRYHRIRGLDTDGRPTATTLAACGLSGESIRA